MKIAQGNNKKLISKKVRKNIKGYPIATAVFYDPTIMIATKLACGFIKYEDGDAKLMKKWFSESDIRKSEKILGEVPAFIEKNDAKSVDMVEQIIGCPHEDIDYQNGNSCPKCSYWKRRDRFTHEILH